MDRRFIDWALGHGVIIDHIEYERMTRVPTVAHPKKKNGVYYYGERRKGCCAWDIDGKWHSYRSSARVELPPILPPKKAQEPPQKRAEAILDACVIDRHHYLEKKALGHVFAPVDRHGNLVVPMRSASGALSGLQFISPDGEKRMLKGTVLKNSRLVLSEGPRRIYVEGYATGLSVVEAAKSIGVDVSVVVCFCAHNLTWVARQDRSGVIIADNDKSKAGEKAAREAKLPFWMPARQGQDANDLLTAGNLPALANAIKRLLKT
ncbi:MAG: hypothetical protein ACK4XK_07930 [Casimicrobiaceae bacterium]